MHAAILMQDELIKHCPRLHCVSHSSRNRDDVCGPQTQVAVTTPLLLTAEHTLGLLVIKRELMAVRYVNELCGTYSIDPEVSVRVSRLARN